MCKKIEDDVKFCNHDNAIVFVFSLEADFIPQLLQRTHSPCKALIKNIRKIFAVHELQNCAIPNSQSGFTTNYTIFYLTVFNQVASRFNFHDIVWFIENNLDKISSPSICLQLYLIHFIS